MIYTVPKKARYLSLILSLTDQGPARQLREITTLCLMANTAPMFLMPNSPNYLGQRTNWLTRARPTVSTARRAHAAQAIRRDGEARSAREIESVESAIGRKSLRILHDSDPVDKFKALFENRGNCVVFGHPDGYTRMPESVRDRIGLSLSLDMPVEELLPILQRSLQKPDITAEELAELHDAIDELVQDRPIAETVQSMLEATRPECDEFDRLNGPDAQRFREQIEVGASIRAGLDIMRLAAARALLEGRLDIDESDVRFVFANAVAHRLSCKCDEQVNFVPIAQQIARNVLGN